ncbi:phosphoenolpyruvate carboxylase, partial [Saccharophagus degradans]|nr:phosphoenolpyruvate carboxylase [Saccharophagus degradans]
TENSPIRISVESLLSKMTSIRKTLKEEHSNLFVDEVDSFTNKVKIFGFHFATMDIRQDSRVHHDVFTGIVKELQEKGDTTFPANYLEMSP